MVVLELDDPDMLLESEPPPSFSIESPGNQLSQKQLQEALFSNEKLSALFDAMMEGGVVLRSTSPGSSLLAVDLQSKDKSANALYYVKQLGDDIYKNRSALGRGGYNVSYALPKDDIPFYFKNMFNGVNIVNGGVPDLIFRRSQRPQAGKEVKLPIGLQAVAEIVVSCYAASCGLGPQVFAAYILPGTDLPFKPTPTDYTKLYMFTRKLSGDLQVPIARGMFTGEEFAEAFVDLLGRSMKHGFWQLDAKPPNMLWERTGGTKRNGSDGTLKFYWTDFDSYYCHIWASTVSDKAKACSIVVHAAMVMGYISCNIGKGAFDKYAPSVAQKLEEQFQISKLGDSEYCDWIDELEQADVFHFGAGDGVMDAKKRIANKFRETMEYYVTDKDLDGVMDPSRRCILTAVLKKPTLMQFFDFAVANANAPDVMYWTTGIPPRRAGQSQEEQQLFEEEQQRRQREAIQQSRAEAERERAEKKRAALAQEEAARAQEEAERQAAVERSKAEAKQERERVERARRRAREEAARRAQEEQRRAQEEQRRGPDGWQAWLKFAKQRRRQPQYETAEQAAERRRRGEWPRKDQMWPEQDVLNAWHLLTNTPFSARNDQLPQTIVWREALRQIFSGTTDMHKSLRRALGFNEKSRNDRGNVAHGQLMFSGIENMPSKVDGQEYRHISLMQFYEYMSAQQELGSVFAKLTPNEERDVYGDTAR